MPPGGGVSGYTTRDVARMLKVSPAQVRGYVGAGLVAVARDSRGGFRFTFQDLVLLRAARDLVQARVPRRRIRRALRQLSESLHGRALSGLRIAAESDTVVVDDGERRWSPESGQLHFDFEVAELARRAAPIARRQLREARAQTADEWYELGCELEAPAPAEARSAYGRALEVDPDHVDAHVNLGRLLHEAGDAAGAERHYRAALAADADDATAAYNLGVVLEDAARLEEALAAYEQALAADPGLADAHYNAAGLCQRLERHAAALRHLKQYRTLVES